MHGGSVRAESDGPGKGSRFIVTLPRVVGAEEEARSETDAVGPAQQSRRILLVDDNRDAAESLATTLRLSGNEVHTAHDGIEALERAEALRPEVIVMDLGMPRLNGYDATRRIRGQEWGRDIVIVALTGWGQESDRRQSREAGCDAHVVKPVDPSHLTDVIAELCARNSIRPSELAMDALSAS
jgi:CheY-like chemotaxis protein